MKSWSISGLRQVLKWINAIVYLLNKITSSASGMTALHVVSNNANLVKFYRSTAMSNLQLLLSIFFFVSITNGHRILGLFPHPGLSHFQFFHPVMKSLAEAGHEVTVVSHFRNEKPIENYKDELLSGKQDGLKNAITLDVSFQTRHLICTFFNFITPFSGSPIQNLTITCWNFSCCISGDLKPAMKL